MRTWLITLFTVLLFSGCSTLRISADYDPGFSFASLKNYTVINEKPGESDSLTTTHITRALEHELALKGYAKTAKSEADFYILIHTDVRSTTEVVTDYEYAGLRPYPYNYYRRDLTKPYPHRPYIDPYDLDRRLVSTTRTYEYQEGKLVIDAFDPKSNKVVWRGIAEDTVPSFDNAQEKIVYINHALNQLLESFPSRQNAGTQ